MSVRAAKPQHEIFYQDLIVFLKKHTGELPAIEMLAVAANMLGKIIALQDQRTITPEAVMDLVVRNIKAGNQQVLDQMSQPQGQA